MMWGRQLCGYHSNGLLNVNMNWQISRMEPYWQSTGPMSVSLTESQWDSFKHAWSNELCEESMLCRTSFGFTDRTGVG